MLGRTLMACSPASRLSARPARESMTEGSRPLTAEQPSNLRDRNARLLDVFEREASAQVIDDMILARVLLTELLRKGSLSQPQRLRAPLPWLCRVAANYGV
jgi:hypothetical protein